MEGLEKNAQKEQEKILSAARKKASEQLEYAESKARSIIEEAKNRAAQEKEKVGKKVLSGLNIEIKRRHIRARDRLLSYVLDRVKQQMSSMIEKPGYREVLCGWIAEAMVGLGTDKATVNASPKEKKLLDSDLLEEAKKKAGQITGSSMEIELSQEAPLSRQGVVLTSADGRRAFNNQVDTRLLRYQSEVRKLIYHNLFEEKQK